MSRNADVIRHWTVEKTSGTANLTTTGGKLYSYNLLIGERDEDYNLVVYNYTASGEYYSMTTSQHVGLALRLSSAELVDPK